MNQICPPFPFTSDYVEIKQFGLHSEGTCRVFVFFVIIVRLVFSQSDSKHVIFFPIIRNLLSDFLGSFLTFLLNN